MYASYDNDISDVDLHQLLNSDTKKLSDEESSDMSGPITVREAGEALKRMKSNKSPGSTGFTAEFFKVFWKKLGNFIVNSINYSYETGHLSISQREGIIICIPKPGKHLDHLPRS